MWLCAHLTHPGLDAYLCNTPEAGHQAAGGISSPESRANAGIERAPGRLNRGPGSGLGTDRCVNASPGASLVVLNQGRVRECGSQAWLAGVRPGMRQAGALVLAPSAVFVNRDEARERQLRDSLALALLPFTPLLAWEGKDSLVLDVSASLALFGGVRRLYRRVQAELAWLGVRLQLAVAPSARGAWLLARAPGRRRRVLRRQRLAARLDGLPAALLDSAAPHLDWLAGLACDTLGALRRLPRAGLHQRGASALLADLDRAYGNTLETFAWVGAPEHFTSQAHSLFPIERHDALLWLARRLLGQLSAWLAARQLALTAVRWTLHHELRRVRLSSTCLDIALAQPVWEQEYLLRLLAERLSAVSLRAPVNAMTLEACRWQPRPGASASLLGDPGGTSDSAPLLDILAARLGGERLLRACTVADHRPERANYWRPFQDEAPVALPSTVIDASVGGVAERPIWLLEKPEPLSMVQDMPAYGVPVYGEAADGVPAYGGRLRLLAGPERIEDGWWDGLAARDYFIAENEKSGVRYWVFREREGGAEHSDVAWFLHGVYA